MFRRTLVFVGLCLSLAAAALAKDRVWTTSDGQTLRGEFVRELDGEVTLLVDGKLITLPLAQLGERDQEIARELAAGKQVADDSAGDSAPAGRGESPSVEPGPPERAPPLIKKPRTPVSRVWTDD